MIVLPTFFRHSPSGTSVASLMHFAELTEQHPHFQSFTKYQYGYYKKNKEKLNIKDYESACPPRFDFKLINKDLPIYGLTCTEDKLGVIEDVEQLFSELQSLGKKAKNVVQSNCGHLTILLGKNPFTLFDQIQDFIENED